VSPATTNTGRFHDGVAGPNDPGAGAVTHETGSPDATEALGARFAASLETGDVIGLIGPLGSGKTRFVTGLARGAAATGRVRSPTFTLVNEYTGRPTLVHLDLYRVDPGEVAGLGLEELIERGAMVVEWAERLPRRWRDQAIEIEFRVTGDSRRALVATARSGRPLELLAAWRALNAGTEARP
jgi:tRNA threonylcarbamoyladenosine biosynthesis protein TsaE